MPDFSEYFGCECMGLNHVVHFSYYPPCPDCEKDEDVIYFTCYSSQWRSRFLPDLWDISSIFTSNYWSNFWHCSFLKRIFIALGYTFKNNINNPENPALDGMDFKKEDLYRLDKLLSHLTNDSHFQCNQDFSFSIKSYSERWAARFAIEKIDESLPYALGWDTRFIPRKILGRLWHGFKYIFNCNGCIEELGFELNKEETTQLKGMIEFVKNQFPDLLDKDKDPGVKVGVTALIVRDGKVLLGLRGDKCQTARNEWAYPGGRMDYGETPTTTLPREIKEETTLLTEEEDLEFLTWMNEFFPDDEKHYISLVFFVKNGAGVPITVEPDKCKEWKWFSPDEIPENTFWACRENVERYADKIRNNK